MRKFFPALLLVLLFCLPIEAQKKYNVYAVGFYNLDVMMWARKTTNFCLTPLINGTV